MLYRVGQPQRRALLLERRQRGRRLPFYADGELDDYYWDREAYPECPDDEPADAPVDSEESEAVEADGETGEEMEET